MANKDKLRPITIKEWERYEWIDATSIGDLDPVFVRGFERTSPPDDGFIYVDKTPPESKVQTWKRIMTFKD
jgi:hypothetical protein